MDAEKKSKAKKIITWIFFIILALALIVLIASQAKIGGSDKGKKQKAKTAQTTKLDKTTIKEIHDWIKEDRRRIKALEKRCDGMETVISDLQAQLAKKSTGGKSQTAVKKTVLNETTPVSEEENNIKPYIPEGQKSEINLDYLRPGGKIIFCIMVNGHPALHFPEYARKKDITFTSIATNPTKTGSNWVVDPVSGLKGDYGVTTTGTFFVKISKIKEVLAITPSPSDGVTAEDLVLKSIYFKGDYKNAWQQPIPMTIIGDYAILETAP